MRDVAARAGVSAMTVSRVLKDERVSAETKERVLAAVRELGYRRDQVARTLRLRGPSGMIGLVVTNLGNPFYSHLALGAEQVAEERGLRLVLGNTGGQVRRERELMEDLAARRVDGIIVVPAGTSHSHLDAASLGGTPVVFASRPPAGTEADTVLVDDFGGARAATAQLLTEGHRAVGFLGNPPALFTGAERFRGYWAAHEEHDLTPREEWIRRGPQDIRAAEAAALEILSGDDPPTALFCTNNRITLGAYRAVRHLGTDTALAGFDDFEMADLLDVPVTVVSYDAEEVGRQAARLLLDRIEQPPGTPQGPPRRTVVPISVVRYGT
ncbi:LacI family DNA-binding transcriptional regulator [Streptomyces sp. 110]|uniref:LacI family DNA-binding transcriptional regulator n=1 Tax=Streptomyces endocoffeicus TaxID=2898945 RepID=A0ABS1Q7K7_9ACTN|nr:LacI family DNA-binding transcriptional regulator [Streptomyces endocoffeicus]MBL1120662.1 LacI family DNA-binding transcriptional regulator [Streptomyces endocoffeicus]